MIKRCAVVGWDIARALAIIALIFAVLGTHYLIVTVERLFWGSLAFVLEPILWLMWDFRRRGIWPGYVLALLALGLWSFCGLLSLIIR